MTRTRMRLWIVRDLQDGAVLFVSDREEEAERELTYFIGTHSKTDDGDLPTIPIPECYAARIGRMVRPAKDAETVERRVDMRNAREEARRDQMSALLRDLMARKGGEA